MSNLTKASRLLVGLALLASTTACSVKYRHEVEEPGTKAQHQKGMGGWIRYDGYEEVAGDLQVAVADFKKEGSPVLVRMVGVIHLADGRYYQKVQALLDASDLVLYEGVRMPGQPEGTVDPSTRVMWSGIAGLLGLKAQVEAIDYGRPRWRQVDMMTDREGVAPRVLPAESLARAEQALQRLADARRQLGAFVDLERMEDAFKHQYALALLQGSDDPGAGFRQMADLAARLRAALAGLREGGGPGGEALRGIDEALAQVEKSLREFAELLITKRNAYVIDALKKELDDSNGSVKPRTIAVFYGAGHMLDYEKRLAELGFKRGKLRFHTAWAMNSRGR